MKNLVTKVGEQYILYSQTILEVVKVNRDSKSSQMTVKCIEVGLNPKWVFGSEYFMSSDWFSRRGGKLYISKSTNFKTLYDKLNG